MDDNESRLKEALDDIFGTDFIDIDNNQKNDNENAGNSFDDMISSVKDSLSKDDNDTQNIEPVATIDNNHVDVTNDDNNNISIDTFEPKEEKLSHDINPNEETSLSNDKPISVTSYDAIDSDVRDSSSSNKKGKGKIAILIVVLVLLAIISVMFIMYAKNVTKKEYCYYEASDKGYKITDSYSILYKNDSVIYVEGVYEYKALTDEYKQQINAIKEEKMPVILNSYGLDGFTHTYELSDDNIKINSYYDVELFNSKIVDKNDDKLNPLSYINIKSNTKFKDLKRKLETESYMCSVSK